MKYTILVVAALQSVLTMVPMQGQEAGQASASGQAVAPAAQQDASEPQLEQRHPRYKLQCMDVLSLTFPLSPEINQTVTIQPDGYINLQNMGSIYVKNLTIPELAEAIKSKLGAVLQNPIVDIDLQDFQKPFFIVSGQVAKPGQYDLRDQITVAEALAVAGGLSTSGKPQVFLFHRTSNDWYKVRKIDMKQIYNGKNLNEDAMIQPGDMIYVPLRKVERFREYVPYGFNVGAYSNPF